MRRSGVRPNFCTKVKTKCIVSRAQSIHPSLLFAVGKIGRSCGFWWGCYVVGGLFFVVTVSMYTFATRTRAASNVHIKLGVADTAKGCGSLVTSRSCGGGDCVNCDVRCFVSIPIVKGFDVRPTIKLSVGNVACRCSGFAAGGSRQLSLSSCGGCSIARSHNADIARGRGLKCLSIPVLFTCTLPLSRSFEIRLKIKPCFSCKLFNGFGCRSSGCLAMSPSGCKRGGRAVAGSSYPSFNGGSSTSSPGNGVGHFS